MAHSHELPRQVQGRLRSGATRKRIPCTCMRASSSGGGSRFQVRVILPDPTVAVPPDWQNARGSGFESFGIGLNSQYRLFDPFVPRIRSPLESMARNTHMPDQNNTQEHP